MSKLELLNEAMDKVRKAERKEHDALKGQKYTFLKNRKNLSDKQEKALVEMIQLYPTIGEAYRLKVLFNDLWDMPNKPAANAFLQQWCDDVEKAKIPAFRLSQKPSKPIGLALFISLNRALPMAFWKASTVKCN